MSKESNTLNVIDVEAEEIPLEVELDGKISKELVKVNVTDTIISRLKDEYSGLTLKSKDDTESYLELKEARKVVRKVEILGEKAFKELKEYPNKVRFYILKKEKEFAEKFAGIYPNLDNGIKEYEDEKLRKETEEKERREKAFQQRQATLIKYGAQYNNGSLELNHISYEIDNIRDSDEEIWESIILPKYKAEFDKNESERVRIEKEREEAALKLKQEQQELLKQQQEMERQRKELADMQAEMQRQKDEAEREKKRIEQDEYDRRSREIRQRIDKRCDQLFFIGMKLNGQNGNYFFEDVNVDYNTEISLLDNEKWNTLISKITPIIEERKKAILEKQIAETEAKKQADIEAALEAERDRVAEEKRLEQIKLEQEKQRKEEELSQGRDKRKWEEFLRQLNEVDLMEMNSTIYKRKAAIAKEKISEIQDL